MKYSLRTKSTMKKNYEFDGEKYKNASAHQKEWGSEIIFEFKPESKSGLKLKGSERILDLGCGDGFLTQKLSGLVPHGKVLGIDASPGMIETAKKLESKNLKFQFMDINDINFIREFDVIFSNATLHWVKDHKKLLNNCYAALRDNGFIRFNFAGCGNCASFYKVIKEVMQLDEYRNYFQNFEWPWYMPDINEYKKLAADSNFKDIRVWEENKDWYFPDEGSMVKWINQPSIVPFLAPVDKEYKEKFRSLVVSKMIAETKQDNGTYFETFRRINLLAHKKT